MKGFILWMILFYFSWPLALLALILYPIVWVFLLPFKLLGFAVNSILDLIKSIITLPTRILGRAKSR